LGNLEALGIAAMERVRDFEARADGVECVAVGDCEFDANAGFTFVETVGWRKTCCGETYARNVSRGQRVQQSVGVDPRRAQLFERSVGTATHGHSGGLQNFDARV